MCVPFGVGLAVQSMNAVVARRWRLLRGARGGGRRGKFAVILVVCSDSPRHDVSKSCYKLKYDAVNAIIRCYLYIFCLDFAAPYQIIPQFLVITRNVISHAPVVL